MPAWLTLPSIADLSTSCPSLRRESAGVATTARDQRNQSRRTPRNPSDCLRLERRTPAPLSSLWRGLRGSASWRHVPEDARRVPLFRFPLHCGERFRYEHDFTADWKLDIRPERVLPLIRSAFFHHASAEAERRCPKSALGPWIASSGWIGTEAIWLSRS
jgi:hypothetical protein